MHTPDTPRTGRPTIEVRNLLEPELSEATLVLQRAFGTFLGAPDPERFMTDRNYVRSRWLADPSAALAAIVDGELVGSNLATRWGSVGFLGPLTVAPENWGQNVGSRLLESTMELFLNWNTEHIGLFTFPQSPKHITLYQKFGFWPRYLTAVMSKAVSTPQPDIAYQRYSKVAHVDRSAVLETCRSLTDSIYSGLDLRQEIRATTAQSLGDTLLVRDGSRIIGFAVCHCGRGTEAGAGNCYVKFGAIQPGPGVENHFVRLLAACISFAHTVGLTRVEAGVSLAREEAYREMRATGFRTQIQGVCMHRPHEPGYHRPGIFVIDDWR